MTPEEAAANIGRRVVYTDPHGPTEFGVITSVNRNGTVVFVRYGHAVNSQATPPERLTFETGGAA